MAIGIALMLSGFPLLAGPWPRGAGEGFLSSEIVSDRAYGMGRIAHRHYLEYGLSDQTTIGAKLDQQTDWTHGRGRTTSALMKASLQGHLYWRRHGLVAPRIPYAVELQLGINESRFTDQLRLAAHLGREFEILERNAWARLGGSLGIAGALRDGSQDVSAQLGFALRADSLAWAAYSVSRIEGTITRRVTVSGAHDLSERFSLTLARSLTLGDWRERGWSLGLWTHF